MEVCLAEEKGGGILTMGVTQVLDKGRFPQSGFSMVLKIRNYGIEIWLKHFLNIILVKP